METRTGNSWLIIRNLGMSEQDNEQVDQTLERLTEVG